MKNLGSFVVSTALLLLCFSTLSFAHDVGQEDGGDRRVTRSNKASVQNIPERQRFSRTIQLGRGKFPISLTIVDAFTGNRILLEEDFVRAVINAAGDRRKHKEKMVDSARPLEPSGTIVFTLSKGSPTEYPLYKVRSTEEKRRMRATLQNFYDQCMAARRGNGSMPDALFVQRGPDEANDIVRVWPGKDIAASPLRPGPKEGYVAGNPPPYGPKLAEASLGFQKTLRMVEGVRSPAASPLRRLAKQDGDFIGSASKGAEKLRKYYNGTETKVDRAKVLHSFATFIEEKIESYSLLTHEALVDELGTETPTVTESGIETESESESESELELESASASASASESDASSVVATDSESGTGSEVDDDSGSVADSEDNSSSAATTDSETDVKESRGLNRRRVLSAKARFIARNRVRGSDSESSDSE